MRLRDWFLPRFERRASLRERVEKLERELAELRAALRRL